MIGIVDETLIPIDAPTTHEPAFVDRKGGHSINCMMVCGSDYQFFLYTGQLAWQRPRRKSSTKKQPLQYHGTRHYVPQWRNTWGLCIPFKTWLMTPLHNNPNSDGERRYNRRLKATRQTIECAYGILKEKFPWLNHLRVNP